jgi:hypothetical protein
MSLNKQKYMFTTVKVWAKPQANTRMHPTAYGARDRAFLKLSCAARLAAGDAQPVGRRPITHHLIRKQYDILASTNDVSLEIVTMTATYYRLWYRLDHTDGYLIWFSNDTDGVVTQSDGIVPSFPDQEALCSYASSHHLTLDQIEPLLHDLDSVVEWFGHSLSAELDCEAFLTAWNLFGDLSASVNGDFDPDRKRTQHVYDKLFWGTNLPSVTRPGKQYTPLWSDEELRVMREVLTNGLLLFRKHVLLP